MARVRMALTARETKVAVATLMCCSAGGILKKCVNGQAVYPLSEQDGLKAQERRYTAYGKEKH